MTIQNPDDDVPREHEHHELLYAIDNFKPGGSSPVSRLAFEPEDASDSAMDKSLPAVGPLRKYGTLLVLSVSPPYSATTNDMRSRAFFDQLDANFEAYDLLSKGTQRNRNWSWAMLEYSTSVTIQDFTHALLASGFKLPFLAASNFEGKVYVMALRIEVATIYAKHVRVSLGHGTITPDMKRFKQCVGGEQLKEKARVMLEFFDGAFRSYGGTFKFQKVDEN